MLMVTSNPAASASASAYVQLQLPAGGSTSPVAWRGVEHTVVCAVVQGVVPVRPCKAAVQVVLQVMRYDALRMYRAAAWAVQLTPIVAL